MVTADDPTAATIGKTPTGQRETLPGPRGVGTAATFDWAIAAELLILAVLVLVGAIFHRELASYGVAGRIAVALVLLVLAAPLYLLGEGLRRGARLARTLQVVFNGALTIYGLIQLPGAVASLRLGRVSPLAISVYLLVVSPVIVWLLTRRQTGAWFARISGDEARARHSGLRWYLPVLVAAILGGASVALASFY